MPIRAVIFDFGGVLVRSENLDGRQKWESRLGLPPGELARLVFNSETARLATLGKLTEGRIWQELGKQFQLGPGALQELQEDFWSGDRLDGELVEFLKCLRPAYKTAILSNAWPGARRTFEEKFGLGSAVDRMIISAEEGLAKPDTEIYRRACRQLDIQPAEAAFVDDFAENIRGALALGMQAIHFEGTTQVLSSLRGLLSTPC